MFPIAPRLLWLNAAHNCSFWFISSTASLWYVELFRFRVRLRFRFGCLDKCHALIAAWGLNCSVFILYVVLLFNFCQEQLNKNIIYVHVHIYVHTCNALWSSCPHLFICVLAFGTFYDWKIKPQNNCWLLIGSWKPFIKFAALNFSRRIISLYQCFSLSTIDKLMNYGLDNTLIIRFYNNHLV